MNLLETYFRGWRESVDAVLEITAQLDDSQWALPTDCPGWSVQDVVAHLAHLESELARGEAGSAVGEGTEVVSAFTEPGVLARRGLSPAEVVAELADAVERRTEQLAKLPDDPSTAAPVTPGGVAWTWDTLLRNRAIDLWVHEQDIRRATGLPGGMGSTGAQVVVMSLSFAMPFVVGKRVRPPASSIVHWDVTGETPLQLTVRVGEDGRASTVDTFDQPSVALRMSTETFTVLTAGRRSPEQVDVTIDGDRELGAAVLAAMAVTQ